MKTGQMFGRYLLLRQIATGGMGELWAARMAGQGGFDKVFALKTVLPQYAKDQHFLDMFIDEARLCAQLVHPNICQVFELDRDGDTYFIAMEYMHGLDLRLLGRETAAHSDGLPVPFLCRIIADAAAGLDYAHSLSDTAGSPYNIVHRDISPQNIFVTFDGSVKVIDFGIAKARGRITSTQDGNLKGKFSYMSPEQSQGLTLDLRSDVFALGIVFHELLTGQSLFTAESSLATLERVRHARVVPPSQLNPRLRSEPGIEGLDRIVLKALERDVAARYQSAHAMQLDVEDWLLQGRVGASHAHLIAFMRELKVKLGASDDPSFIPDDDLPEVSIERGLSQVGGDETPERKTVALPPVKVPESLEPPASSESVAQPARRRKTTRRVALAAGGVALLVSVVLGVWAVPSLFAKPVVSRAVLDLAFEAPLSPPMECRTHDVAAVARIERALLSANVLDALLAEPVVDSAEYLALVARASLASGRPADAAAKHAVALCPSWALPHHLQGKAAQGLDHLDEAEGCYREAIRLLPDWDAPAFNLSLVLLAKPGAKGEAVTLLDGLIAKNPLDPKTHLLRGQAMLEAQRPKDAIADLEEALRLDPSEPTAKKLLETARRVR